MLSIERTSLSYGGEQVLQSVGLRIAPGEVTVILGPSGSGKSTLLRVAALLERPDSGEWTMDSEIVRFDGRLASNVHPWPRVTMVFQDLFLWPHLTLRANIMLAPELVRVPIALNEVEDLISHFEKSSYIDRYPNEMSGGQRQRGALVRALVLKPKYLLLDEITSALDVEQAEAIVSKIVTLKSLGIGMALVTHHIRLAQRVADTIVFLTNGQTEETGPPSILETPESAGLQSFTNAYVSLFGPLGVSS